MGHSYRRRRSLDSERRRVPNDLRDQSPVAEKIGVRDRRRIDWSNKRFHILQDYAVTTWATRVYMRCTKAESEKVAFY